MDPFEKFIAEVMASVAPHERPVVEDLSRRVDTVVRQERQWIAELEDTVETLTRIGADATWTVFPVFWVRLHGVFTELLDTYRVLIRADDSLPKAALDRCRAVYEAADGMLRALTDDEHVVADYYRQRAAHLKQDAYTVRFARNQAPADVRRSGKQTKVVDTRNLSHIEKRFSASTSASSPAVPLRHVLRWWLRKAVPERPQPLALRALQDVLHRAVDLFGVYGAGELVVLDVRYDKPLDGARDVAVPKSFAAAAEDAWHVNSRRRESSSSSLRPPRASAPRPASCAS